MSARRFTQHQSHVSPGVSANSNTSNSGGLTKKSVLLLGVMFVIAVVTMTPVQPGKPEMPAQDFAGQGHAKRYLRINEYLFHGVQKTTAIALHSAEHSSTYT